MKNNEMVLGAMEEIIHNNRHINKMVQNHSIFVYMNISPTIEYN